MNRARQALPTREQRGFTIVELLIVIVIIGILAAITVVVFNGIQERATNSARISAARSFVQATKLFVTQNGRMFNNTSLNGGCLGRNSANLCQGVSATDITNGNDMQPDPVLDAELRTVLTTIPSVPEKPVVPNESWYWLREIIGPVLIADSDRYVDDELFLWGIHYWLQGSNKPCGQEVIRDMGWDSVEGRTLYEMGTTSSYTISQAGTTECIVPLRVP
jgi:prepilin-type N-terminal cleavage/methylation domain-containing protein